MDLWLAWLVPVLQLEEVYLDKLCLLKTNACNEFTDNNCLLETVYKEFPNSRPVYTGFFFINQNRGQGFVGASQKPEACPVIEKVEQELGRYFKDSGSLHSRKLSFHRTWLYTRYWCSLERVMRASISFLFKTGRPDFKDAAVSACGASIGRNPELSWMDEMEAPWDIRDELKHDGTNCSSDMGCRKVALGSSKVKIQDDQNSN